MKGILTRPVKWLRRSIRHKLVTMIVAVIAIICVFILFYFPMHLRGFAEHALTEKANSIGSMVAHGMAAPLIFGDEQAAQQIIEAAATNEDLSFIVVTDENGREFCSYSNPGVNVVHSPSSLMNRDKPSDHECLVFTTPVKWNEEGVGQLRFGFSLAAVEEAAAQSRSRITLISITLFVVGIISAILIGSAITRPLLNMVAAARAIAEGDTSHRATVASRDEVQQLASTFNQMVDKLLFTQQKLADMNELLEDRVEERTSELQAEVTGHELAKERITASLREKETLLKEVHHRVKNNLQIISSLLNLQVSKISDHETQAMFRDSQGRVKSMALIHEKLYRSDDLSRISFAEYTQSLTNYLLSTISGNLERIKISRHIDKNVLLGVDAAVPCGLIINELVTNSLKYAFPETHAGEITISCQQDETGLTTLKVSDDGVGIPEDVDYRNTNSLGLQLIVSLTSQLEGEVNLSRDSGTEFTIRFDSQHETQRVTQDVNV